MNDNQFDEFFRNKLVKYAPVPEDMWQRIRQKRDRDRKGFFFKCALAVLLFIFLTAGYFILQINRNTVNKKAIYPTGTPGTEIQNNAVTLSKKTGNDEPIKLPTNTASIQQAYNRDVTNKAFDNNRKDIYSDKHQNKKSKAGKYFSSENTAPGKYILKQKDLRAKKNRVTPSVKGSAKISTINGSDSSVNNYPADENIVQKDPDTSAGTPAIKIFTLPKDSLSQKTLTPAEHISKKETALSSLRKKWFLDVYASPDIPFNEVTSGNAATTDYIKKSFKTHLSYTIGLGIGRLVDKHFSVKTGWQYSKIIAQMTDSNGVGIASHYRSIDIPLVVGYEIKNSDFKTTINAGVIFNLYSWYKGANINNYKRYTGISLYTGINFVKQINNKFELFAEPYFRYRLSYMTKPQAPFNQKIHIAGASFGLKYNF